MTGQKVTMVSLDLSTKVSGFSVWQCYGYWKYQESFVIDFSDERDTNKRIDKMCSELWSQLDRYSPTVVYAEDTYCHGNPDVQKKLNRIQGVVYAWCLIHHVEFHLLMPSVWRKYIPGFPQGKGIKRNEQKKFSVKYFKDNYGKTPWSDDESDAVCIGEAAIRILSE